eukprot:1104161-Rhodomonas_salina.2
MRLARPCWIRLPRPRWIRLARRRHPSQPTSTPRACFRSPKPVYCPRAWLLAPLNAPDDSALDHQLSLDTVIVVFGHDCVIFKQNIQPN